MGSQRSRKRQHHGLLYEIEAIRHAIAGRPLPGMRTLAGEVLLERLHVLMEFTGDYKESLPDLWDRLVNQDILRSAQEDKEYDLIPTVHRFAERVIALAGQYLDIPADELEGWSHYQMERLLTTEARWA